MRISIYSRKSIEFLFDSSFSENTAIISRSAGCAAAILEHFNQSGNSIFSDDRYHPDKMVYYAVLDALEAFSDNN